MNKTAIKSFATSARISLIEAAKQKAFEYQITEEGPYATDVISIGEKILSSEEKAQRVQLITEINKKGFNQVMEEAAYTWFNRFIALRFMEVNGYLPTMVRVFTNEEGEFKPAILSEAMTVELQGLDKDKVFELLDKQANEELYKMLLIAQCNDLSNCLPGMFETISNWTELLFPSNLLKPDSVIGQMVLSIPEEDWTDQVQIIGWLYQYYNSEKKDEVFAALKKNVKISKDNIPAATQLFTPDWIVRYMVENSLGRLWTEGHPDEEIKTNWKYYIEEAEQEPEVEEELKKIRAEYSKINPEDIKVIDPCMGSGHILVYAFDVLMQIYVSQGWSERDAAQSILENNLYGLDIDDRAGQLSYFAVMMMARKYSRRILTKGIVPNVMAIQDSSNINVDTLKFIAGNDQTIYNDLLKIKTVLQDAKEYGSILNVPMVNFDTIYRKVDEAMASEGDLVGEIEKANVQKYVLPILKQSQVMAQKYDVCATNPPYMGGSGMSGKLSDFVKENYPDSKSDLFACFIEKCGKYSKSNGMYAMITQHAFMFLSSYEKLREKLMQKTTVNMAHLGARAFDEIGGEVVQTTVFVNRNSLQKNYLGTYARLVDVNGESEKETLYLSGEYRYTAKQENFSKIPGMPVAYWASSKAIATYESPNMDKVAQPRHGLATSDNNRFLRLWYEVNLEKTSLIQRCDKSKKWFPMSKGGSFRRWYGNLEWIINYENDGKELKDFAIAIYKCSSRTIQNTQFYFKEGLTWSALTSGVFSVRWQEEGALFGSGGYCAFTEDKNRFSILALLNSKVTAAFAQYVSPTLNYEVGHIKTIPVVMSNENEVITKITKDNIMLSRNDWDSFETSWDFEEHPLVRCSKSLWDATAVGASMAYYYGGHPEVNSPMELCYMLWQGECNERFKQLKANEEELNQIFIDIYGLQDELTPEVEDKDVTVRKADLVRDVKSFISYAVGCMFGRYSLDTDGLAYAGGDFDSSKYSSFIPDSDNIIPICDDEYFEDDIVGRFVDFVKVVYGEETLEDNLKFIAAALGGKGTPREIIRNYFLNDFFADHCKIYQKRPIYWLFDSGKKNGFKALIYMHRYQPDTIARIRTEYVHEMQARYATAIEDVEKNILTADNKTRVRLTKQLAHFKDQDIELRAYEEKVHYLADQMISIDLDDGVKTNYAKFESVLAKIK